MKMLKADEFEMKANEFETRKEELKAKKIDLEARTLDAKIKKGVSCDEIEDIDRDRHDEPVTLEPSIATSSPRPRALDPVETQTKTNPRPSSVVRFYFSSSLGRYRQV
ncbi:hypothetical protein CRG98_025865 [Punica granatum]|uniref:Uncharacterized protein n=1 Tax=Punica granatum TaxID=22663 RepID=A0A2I0JBX3_PUNGR|nr:hypothetical protein CRG98_025865 [Punica granatum]